MLAARSRGLSRHIRSARLTRGAGYEHEQRLRGSPDVPVTSAAQLWVRESPGSRESCSTIRHRGQLQPALALGRVCSGSGTSCSPLWHQGEL